MTLSAERLRMIKRRVPFRGPTSIEAAAMAHEILCSRGREAEYELRGKLLGEAETEITRLRGLLEKEGR